MKNYIRKKEDAITAIQFKKGNYEKILKYLLSFDIPFNFDKWIYEISSGKIKKMQEGINISSISFLENDWIVFDDKKIINYTDQEFKKRFKWK